jgi:molybdate transport system substrate-binding protein
MTTSSRQPGIGRSPLLALVWVALGLLLAPGSVAAAEVLVFAAASLKNVLDELAVSFTGRSDAEVVVSYAGSSALARQIEAGAPADVFLSANPEWMAELERQGLIRAGSRIDLLGNDLVLIAPRGSAAAVEPTQPDAFIQALGDGPLAMANTDAVPAGQYGKAALQTLGLWPEVEAKVAQTDNVRAALALVARGEAPLGVVYATDAAVEPAVEVVAAFDPATHPKIVYVAAIVVGSKSEQVERFLEFLESEPASSVFRQYGFVPLR